jgi:hypothetical protein
MPLETQLAIDWALQQNTAIDNDIVVQVTKDTPHFLVDKVREYFNTNDIEYSAFSYEDLIPFLN